MQRVLRLVLRSDRNVPIPRAKRQSFGACNAHWMISQNPANHGLPLRKQGFFVDR